MRISAIITAGGVSSRYSKDKNKLLEIINGKTVIEHSVQPFLNSNICQIVLVANSSIIAELSSIFKNESKIKIVEGGKSRQESVYKGLQEVSCDYVLIHDGARPLVNEKIINDVVDLVIEKKAVTVVTKTTDTIKEVGENGKILRTIPRKNLYNTQTPQAFEYNLIMSAHDKLKGEIFTDDAGMLESLGMDVYICNGEYENIKITTPNDIILAEIYFNNKQ